MSVRFKLCSHQGCTTRASFGSSTRESKPEFCALHAKDGMPNVFTKLCADGGCTKPSKFGVEGQRSGLCSQHAKERMIDLLKRRCAQERCNATPTFGVPGTKTRKFCKRHAKDGMVSLASGACEQEGCSTRSSFGVPGSKTRRFCLKHAKEGMVILRTCKRCASTRAATRARGSEWSAPKTGTFAESTRRTEWLTSTRKIAATEVAQHVPSTPPKENDTRRSARVMPKRESLSPATGCASKKAAAAQLRALASPASPNGFVCGTQRKAWCP